MSMRRRRSHSQGYEPHTSKPTRYQPCTPGSPAYAATSPAVTVGLTLPWSSGPVEGNVNPIKTIKRQMYGRAGLGLLRKRILTPV
jgi:hypothetical protein